MRRKTVFIYIGILLLSLPVFTWMHLHRQSQHALDQQYTLVNHLYSQLSEQRLNLLHAVVDQIVLRDDIRQALHRQDRQQLLRLMQPAMAHLQDEYGISLLYFHDPFGNTLLRVHQPEVYGERLNRYLLSAAMQTKESVQGLEIGSQGLLSLRVIRPIQANGAVIGFIEMGEDIDGLVQQLTALTGSRLLLTVDKVFVSRAGWETGLQFTGRKNVWDMLPDSVIPHAFIKQFPTQMLTLLFEKERGAGDAFRFVMGGEHYAGKVFPLRDTVQSVVGNMLILQDTTADSQLGQLILLASIVLSSVLGALVVTLGRKE